MKDILKSNKEYWDHSIKCWLDDDIRAYCLALQDTHSIDINLILLIDWLHGQGLEIANQEQIFNLSSDFQRRMLRPLRRARVGLKGTPYYEEAKSLELKVEKEEQMALLSELETKQSDKDLALPISDYFIFMSIIGPKSEAKKLAKVIR